MLSDVKTGPNEQACRGRADSHDADARDLMTRIGRQHAKHVV